jgi:ElaB/YqjD/DUF883 family membrane-anchored ribosome-binding protein
MDKDNVRKMADTITKDGDNALDRVQDVTENAWQRGREGWKDLSAQSKLALTGAQKNAEEAWEDAQQLVQKHPAKTVSIALLIGAAIGALLAFRKND